MQQQAEEQGGQGGNSSIDAAATALPGSGGVSRADGLGGAAVGGAQSTNRAPQSYKQGREEPCRILRTTIDSLYLSYAGELSPQADDRLAELKQAAQSDNEWERAAAQWITGDHLFAVLDKAPRPYRYVLKDERFHIQVSRGDKVPLAYAQVASQYLTTAGIVEAEKALRFVVNGLGLVVREATISRVDLCADFVPCLDVDQFGVEQWVTRTRQKERYWDGDRPTGWKIGKGGPVQCRLYDKVLEIARRSHKDYLLPIWRANGWQPDEPVWRLEFQFNRAFLREARIATLDDLLAQATGLWRYATEEWLRLCIPLPADDNRARWPCHPLWSALGDADWDFAAHPAIVRVRSAGMPSDQQLFTIPLGYVASFMAREGITDWDAGLKNYLEQARWYHQRNTSGSIALYVQRKARLKGREFFTIDNRKNHPADRAANIAFAQAYQLAKDGE